MKLRRAQEMDKATNRKLVPVQTWIFPKTKKEIIMLAKKNDKTLTQYIRFLIENDCDLRLTNRPMDKSYV